MRFVQVMIPSGRRDAVVGVLNDEDIDYTLTDETSGREYTAVATFLLPVEAVEVILDRLREVGIERDAYTVVVKAETVMSDQFEELEESYENSDGPERIAQDELVDTAEGFIPDLTIFAVMTVLSAVVATAGVLLDSAAVVVGSMVIAPLIGPAMATSVGTVTNDQELFRRGVKLQLLGGFLAVGSAAAFASVIHFSNAVPMSIEEIFAIDEVRERLLPDVLSLVIAVAAGTAGAFSMSSGVSSALVGVMIAAALVPPTAVVGIGIAWGDPRSVLGSFVLVLVNFISINLAALAVFWYQGYQPKRWFRRGQTRMTLLRRTGTLAVLILVLSVFLLGVTYSAIWISNVETDAREEVDRTLQERGLVLLSMEIQYDDIPLRTPTSVVVTVGYLSGTDPPTSVASALSERLNEVVESPLGLRSIDEVAVQVRYVAVECQPEACDASGIDTVSN